MPQLFRGALWVSAIFTYCASGADPANESGDVVLEHHNRSVKYYVDSTFTHKYLNYNLLRFNCAHFVHFALQGYGVTCKYLHGAIALPSCGCDPIFGCSNSDQQPGSMDALVQQYMRVESDTNETHDPGRMTLHVADGGVANSLVNATQFEIEVVRTWVPESASYHVSLLGRWKQGEIWKMISLSGWPYDTIHSWSTIKDLFTGHFTVAFPDPTMRRAYLQNQSEDLKVIARLNDTIPLAQLPGNASQIKSCYVTTNWSWPKDNFQKILVVQVEGQEDTLKFIEQENPETFVRMVDWPMVRLQLRGEVWEYDVNQSEAFPDLPWEVLLVEYEGTFFMQRPQISTWMRTLFTLLTDGRKWKSGVRPPPVTSMADVTYV